MQTVRNSEELARARGRAEARRQRSRWCRPWARSTPATWRWSRRRRRRADRVAATIFVNPLQFGAERGSRPLSAAGGGGRAMLEDAGCDLLWLPSVERHLSRRLRDQGQRRRRVASAGKARRGPAISTASRRSSPSCCSSVRPDVALFGEKDFQQLAVIRRMVADLGHAGRDRRRADGARAGRPRPVVAQRLSVAPTSGSARSRLPQALEAARDAIRRRRRRSPTSLDEAKQSLVEAGFLADRLFRAGRCRDARAARRPRGRDAPDRRRRRSGRRG